MEVATQIFVKSFPFFLGVTLALISLFFAKKWEEARRNSRAEDDAMFFRLILGIGLPLAYLISRKLPSQRLAGRYPDSCYYGREALRGWQDSENTDIGSMPRECCIQMVPMKSADNRNVYYCETHEHFFQEA